MGATPARAQDAPLELPLLGAQLVAGGFDGPTWAGSPPGDGGRIFVLEREGRIRLVKDGTLLATPFLDLTDKVDTGAQGGLLGLAFHSDFERNGWFYVYYSIGGKSSVLERYTVSAHQPDLADPGSVLQLIAPLAEPLQYHMGGGLAFGPDGRVYVAIGDTRDAPLASCAAQRLDSLLGKLLRLEDDGGIPADNPFVGVPGARPEIWDLGLRQPFRIAFDRDTGDLFIGDVGDLLREEVELHPGGAPGGINWGWPVMEGELCTGAPQCAAWPCPSPDYALPAYSYTHEGHACCVLGGGVYRGGLLPALEGAYVYGDYCTKGIFALQLSGGLVIGQQSLDLAVPGGAFDELVFVGTDADGELLLLDHEYGAAGKGELWRVGLASFTDLGGSLGGATLAGTGQALPGSALTFSLGNAKPGAPAHLVVGVGLLGLPFKGGVMLPTVGLVLSGLAVGSTGGLTLVTTWPGGVPAGTPVVMQWWIQDPAGPAGFAASNALMIVAF